LQNISESGQKKWLPQISAFHTLDKLSDMSAFVFLWKQINCASEKSKTTCRSPFVTSYKLSEKLSISNACP